MKTRMLAAAALAAVVATPALAQGMDSRHSPFPPTAYSGYVPAWQAGPVSPRFQPAPAYRYSGTHSGGPADALLRD